MKRTSHHIHPAFTLNGLHFETAEELHGFAKQLKADGDEHEVSMGKFLIRWLDDNDTIPVRTSGSTGKPKKIALSKSSMINSAMATGTFFKVGEHASALLCLHPKFIAGKMMIVRAMVMGWQLHVVAPEKDALTQYDNDYDFAAMVPYQVNHSIKDLGKVKKLIIGGGPVSNELEAKLQKVDTEAFATYGMTETCTHIAVRRLNGPARSNTYSAMPDVKFDVDKRGCLRIEAPKIVDEVLKTNDIVDLRSKTSFRWLGRYDNVINSGGIKIYPESVEQQLQTYISYPFIIASEKDEALGERLILVLEKNSDEQLPNYTEAFSKLAPYEKPKRIYTVSKFAYTKTGKVKRRHIMEVVRKYR